MHISTLTAMPDGYQTVGLLHSLRTMQLGFLKDLGTVVGEIVGEDLGQIDKNFIRIRNRAMNDIIEKAKKMKADQIIGLKLDFTQVSSSILVVAAYATAIKRNQFETAGKTRRKRPKHNRSKKKL